MATVKKKRQAAGFKVGQQVVYPSHGVGKIRSIAGQELAGEVIEMFEVFIDEEKLTLRVPVKRAVEVGLRPLAAPEIMDKALKTLKGKPGVKRLMWSRRAQEYEHKINSGNIVHIAEVLRDLHRRDDQKEQSYSERQLYELAFERFTREYAAVTGDNRDTVCGRTHSTLQSRKR